MGQVETISEKIDSTSDDVVRQTRHFMEFATLSYDNLLKSLQDLNALSNRNVDSKGRKLIFGVKKGTDTTVFWKHTIRITCARVDVVSNKIESFKLLTLSELLKVAHTLHSHSEAAAQSSLQSSTHSELFNSSVIFQDVDTIPGESFGECCVCLERKPDVILPCAHSYCLPCIEQWNVKHKTCPICRENIESTDDSWVISEAPGSEEISQEIQKSLLKII